MIGRSPSLLRQTFPQVAFYLLLKEIRKALKGCRSCLDVGCGTNSPIGFLDLEHTVGLEAHGPSLEIARQHRTHTEFRMGRAEEIGSLFSQGEFDCCIALDLIEHLPKEQGVQFISDLERVTRKAIVLFTPNGFLHQESQDGDLQEHLSGWTVEDMRALGFTVIGMHGHRSLRGEQHRIRYWPGAFWGIISVLTHLFYTRAHPESAAALLCVKKAGKDSA